VHSRGVVAAPAACHRGRSRRGGLLVAAAAQDYGESYDNLFKSKVSTLGSSCWLLLGRLWCSALCVVQPHGLRRAASCKHALQVFQSELVVREFDDIMGQLRQLSMMASR
jgi:hypothetical protein